MANAVFDHFVEELMGGVVSLADDVKVVLVDTADYTFSAAHESLADVPAGARVATSDAMTGKTFTDGTFNADPTSLGAAITGDESEALILFIDTGVESTSTLVYYIDSTSDSSLPYTPVGVGVVVNWNASGIFSL